MKSCFFILALGAFLLQPETALAAKKKPVSAKNKIKTSKPVAAPQAASDAAKTETVHDSTFDKFYSRLKISYFGVVTSSNLESWDQSRASISPEWGISDKGNDKNSDTWPVNLWSQLSFNYNFGYKMNFVVNPRWVTMLGSTKRMKEPEDNSFLMLDDVLVGFQGVIWASKDGKFAWWARPGVRLPTSRVNRTNNNRNFGTISHQVDFLNQLTYDFNPTWQVGAYAQARMWVYEQRYNDSRMRYYVSPFITYSVSDDTKIQAYYEVIWENDRNFKSINGKNPLYKDYWQNVMLAVGQQITPKLNIMPYIATYVNDVPLSMRSAWFGAWISYSIK